MKSEDKLLLLLILFPIDLNDFLRFIEEKAPTIEEKKNLLIRILSPQKYLHLIEGTYFLKSSVYLNVKKNIDSDRTAFADFVFDDKNIPFLIYCLRRYSFMKKHPISKHFIHELSYFFKRDCNVETDSLRSAI